jgi:DNA-binding LytR/AlgR family response regulator
MFELPCECLPGSRLKEGSNVRVHRSAIANIACIRAIEPIASGDQRLTLDDGTVLKVSRTHRAEVVNAVGRRLRGEKEGSPRN